MASVSRYVPAGFPAFIGLAVLVRSAVVHQMVTVAVAMLTAVLALHYFAGVWVAWRPGRPRARLAHKKSRPRWVAEDGVACSWGL